MNTRSLVLLNALLAAVLLAAVGAVLLIKRRKAEPPPPTESLKTIPEVGPGFRGREEPETPEVKGEAPKSEEPAPESAPLKPRPPIEEIQARIDVATMSLNAASIALTAARLTDNKPEEKELAELVRAYRRDIQDAWDEGGPEQDKLYVRDHLEPGDLILAVEDVDLRRLKPEEASAQLHMRLELIRPGTHWKARIRRGTDEMDAGMYFHQTPSAVISIVQTHDKWTAAALRRLEPIPAAVLAGLRDRIGPLPEYYRKCWIGDEEIRRIEALMKAGAGSADDVRYLTVRVLGELWNGIREEIDFLEARAKELEKLLASGAAYDVLYLDDGTAVSGRIIAQDAKTITLEMMFGRVTYKKEIVRSVGKSESLDAEFAKRYAMVKGAADLLADLGRWCRANRMPLHEEVVWLRLLQVDPEYVPAREGLGFRPGPNGRWKKPLDVRPAKDKLVFNAREYSVEDLRKKFVGLGFVELNGKWYQKEPWKFTFGSVHAPRGLRWTGTSVSIQKSADEESLLIGHTDPAHGTAPAPEHRKARHWFFAPNRRGEAAAEGKLRITIEAPAPFLECSIRALGHVLEGRGEVEVAVTVDGAKQPVRVYQIRNGSDFNEYDISSVVKGKKRFYIVVRLKEESGINQYARFLPTVEETKESLVIRAQIADPLPDLDKAMKQAMERKPVPTEDK